MILVASHGRMDAFANTFHLLGGGSQPNQPNPPTYAQQPQAAPAAAAAAEYQQKERRMSDIEHLYETSRKIDFEDF
ncbi:hypothetical protein OESDEN_00849 [Oesophagostomum dentatum]|uniref:Uncharacterized protein n=1 Tax=Oesophagostomum dentatum TaxID=61180 RepID=A0A0B1TNS7_OESDE|nr:hypothetical protein OESDEN_00849 [Oesophagostomum dentatum]